MYIYHGKSHSKNYVAVPPVLANRGSIEQESLEDIFIQYAFIHSFFQQCSSTARYLWYHLVSCHFPPTPYVTLDTYRPQAHSHLGTFVLIMSGVLFSPILIPLFKYLFKCYPLRDLTSAVHLILPSCPLTPYSAFSS